MHYNNNNNYRKYHDYIYIQCISIHVDEPWVCASVAGRPREGTSQKHTYLLGNTVYICI